MWKFGDTKRYTWIGKVNLGFEREFGLDKEIEDVGERERGTLGSRKSTLIFRENSEWKK